MLGQFADGHDFEEDMSKDALPAVGDDPSTGGGMTPSKGSKRRFCRGSTEWIMAGATPFQDIVKYRVASCESQEKNEYKIRFSINLRRKLSSKNFCRKRQRLHSHRLEPSYRHPLSIAAFECYNPRSTGRSMDHIFRLALPFVFA